MLRLIPSLAVEGVVGVDSVVIDVGVDSLVLVVADRLVLGNIKAKGFLSISYSPRHPSQQAHRCSKRNL